MSLQESRDALEAFAKDPIDEGFSRLEPWQSMNVLDYYAPDHSLGDELSAYGQVSFPYEPMTPEEYNEITGANVPSDINPAEYGGFATWLAEYEVFNSRYASHANRYVDAIQGTGSATTFGPPGNAPWKSELKDDWDAAVDNRCAEVDVVRNELTFMMETLVKAAEDYADTDLGNSVKLSKYDFEES